ncbi:phosphotransferase [Verrucosispora sp. WMMC514]|uniref:phosphotransferase n=1 Tax=Verrucosispora sp. WMMC514 TaxID=3015156 RepID=UPI00248CE0BD|nr:phosphotransferase [Verrucosispora sp. WMMC514]WBB91356.1 phosphotransferase [Verrucosispora sp. WMMC514]
MFASRRRPRWAELPASVRRCIEGLLGGAVVDTESCAGGFSPGFASRITLRGGHRAFVKAVDAHLWPTEASHYRAEAEVAGRLPQGLPVPRLLTTHDDGRWVLLVFEQVDGVAPERPWTTRQIRRVVTQAVAFAQATTPSPIVLPRDHPRLGGWAHLALDPSSVARLHTVSTWASRHLDRLTAIEQRGLHAAQGDSLVHCDLYPHNVLLSGDRVMFVDWPHARLGAPVIDIIALLTGMAADGVDPEPHLHTALPALNCPPDSFDAILTAHTGFLMAGALTPMPTGLQAIAEEKLRLATAATRWLQHRHTHTR